MVVKSFVGVANKVVFVSPSFGFCKLNTNNIIYIWVHVVDDFAVGAVWLNQRRGKFGAAVWRTLVCVVLAC